jgi:hypothetical protein
MGTSSGVKCEPQKQETASLENPAPPTAINKGEGIKSRGENAGPCFDGSDPNCVRPGPEVRITGGHAPKNYAAVVQQAEKSASREDYAYVKAAFARLQDIQKRESEVISKYTTRDSSGNWIIDEAYKTDAAYQQLQTKEKYYETALIDGEKDLKTIGKIEVRFQLEGDNSPPSRIGVSPSDLIPDQAPKQN